MARAVEMTSPSGEVLVVLPARGTGRWLIRVRGVTRYGRGLEQFLQTGQQLVENLDRDALTVPAGELRRLLTGLDG